MDYTIRNIREAEYKVLSDFLYEAIFIPEGVKSPSKDIINKPELQVYISDFGKHKGDYCLVAESDKKNSWCSMGSHYEWLWSCW